MTAPADTPRPATAGEPCGDTRTHPDTGDRVWTCTRPQGHDGVHADGPVYWHPTPTPPRDDAGVCLRLCSSESVPCICDLDLHAIESRANAATAEPWRVHIATNGNRHHVLSANGGYVVQQFMPASPQTFRDAEFIAHARADVPALVAALRAARQRLAAVEGALKRIAPVGSCPYRHCGDGTKGCQRPECVVIQSIHDFTPTTPGAPGGAADG